MGLTVKTALAPVTQLTPTGHARLSVQVTLVSHPKQLYVCTGHVTGGTPPSVYTDLGDPEHLDQEAFDQFSSTPTGGGHFTCTATKNDWNPTGGASADKYYVATIEKSSAPSGSDALANVTLLTTFP